MYNLDAGTSDRSFTSRAKYQIVALPGRGRLISSFFEVGTWSCEHFFHFVLWETVSKLMHFSWILSMKYLIVSFFVSMHNIKWTQTFSTWIVPDLCLLCVFLHWHNKYWKSTKDALYMVAEIVDSRPSRPSYMQKAGDSWDISPQIFLDFLQNFRLRTRNQYCTQAIAWDSTI